MVTLGHMRRTLDESRNVYDRVFHIDNVQGFVVAETSGKKKKTPE
jgi:hypothetical protein